MAFGFEFNGDFFLIRKIVIDQQVMIPDGGTVALFGIGIHDRLELLGLNDSLAFELVNCVFYVDSGMGIDFWQVTVVVLMIIFFWMIVSFWRSTGEEGLLF